MLPRLCTTIRHFKRIAIRRIRLRHMRLVSSSASPSERYNLLIKSCAITRDPKQERVVTRLEALYDTIKQYKSPQLPLNETKLPSDAPTIHNIVVPNGLYIYGGPGTGKTMLMDLFYDSITSHSKQRVHFNEFMLELHAEISEYTKKLRSMGLSPKEMKNYDAVPHLSLEIAKASTVLCFDEFHVTDIANAVILNRLFTALFYFGVVCVMTSNREPNMLYHDGLQRKQIFEPFLDLLVTKVNVIDLNSIDYRLQVHMLKNTYFIEDEDGTNNKRVQFEDAWKREVKDNHETKHILPVFGKTNRTLACPRCIGIQKSKGVRFKFEELCEANLGSADYLALSRSFCTIFIEDVPYFGYSNRNEMKRFILLIDELYNSKNRVVCLAADEPENLLTIDRSVQKYVFEDMFQFDRCSSRLMEMQSQEYLDSFRHFWRIDELELYHVD